MDVHCLRYSYTIEKLKIYRVHSTCVYKDLINPFTICRTTVDDNTVISKKPGSLHCAEYLPSIINCRDIREPSSQLLSFVPNEIIRLHRIALDSMADISDCITRLFSPATGPLGKIRFVLSRHKYRIADVKQHN